MTLRSMMTAIFLLLLVAAPAAQPIYPGGSGGPIYCNRSAWGVGAPGSYEVVPLGGGTSIYVCGQNVTATAAATWQMSYGTGTACATGTTNLTPPFSIAPQAPLASRSPVAGHFLPRGNALCVTVGGTGPAQWVIFYSQF